jgi:hypothetical protein
MNTPEETPEGVQTQEVDDSTAQDQPKASETQVEEPSVNMEGVMSGYQEALAERNRLEEENIQLRQEAAQRAAKSEGDDESEEARIEREVERRTQASKELADFEKAKVQREVDMLERINPTFKENKEAILQISIDQRIPLAEAAKAFEARNAEAKKTVDKHHEARKKSADGKQTASQKPGVQTRKYDPKKDAGRSFADMYSKG